MDLATPSLGALLGQFRREKNGAVAGAMRYYGRRYGLNYGVSLATIRRISASVRPSAQFAHLLYRQQVRELQLAAFTVMPVEEFDDEACAFFARGVVNSEIAEEYAQRLLVGCADAVRYACDLLCSDDVLLDYASVLTLARVDWSQSEATVLERLTALLGREGQLPPFVVEGAAAMLESYARKSKENRQTVASFADSLGSKNGALLREELSWRLDYID